MIRAYQTTDLNRLLEVWYSASQIGHPFLNEAFFEQEREDIALHYLPVSETWVYEHDGVVVGFISLHGNEVGGLFVDAAFHKQGIGRALMDHIKDSHEVLELDVFEANVSGRKFYEHYGFHQVSKHVNEATGLDQLRLRFDRRH